MNEPPTFPDLPFGDDTDEAISALIDGELGAFATERGMTEASARARLEAWPRYASRRAAIEQVRAAVGADAEPLDDVTRRRLVRTATNAVPTSEAPATRQSRSWVWITAAAAAVLLVIVGIGFAISATGDSGKSTDSSASGSAATSADPLRGDVGELGDVSSPQALRSLLDRRAAAADDSAKQSESVAPPAPEQGGTSAAADGGTAIDAATCARRLAGSREVRFTGTGTYRGTPVTIVGITDRGRTIVFVVPDTDCTNVLASISR
jgi:hypothetical protein